MNEKKYTIYMHKNKSNNKVYIGQTSQDPKKRWDGGNGYKTSIRFYNAIQKYGWNNFEHIILFTNLSAEEANSKEKELIEFFNSTNDNFGYNIQNGGKNFSHSEETKKRIGLANAKSLLGKKHSEEQNKKMSELFTGEGNPFYGKKHKDETKQRISEARKGKCCGKEHHMFGKHHTEENKQKISQARQGKGGKAVICLNTMEVFDCMMDAARWCGLKTSASIGQVCNQTGKQKTAGKHPETGEKLYWKYYNEGDINE